MNPSPPAGKSLEARGFTLIELLAALVLLSLLALMSHRGLGAVLDAREHVSQETANWKRLAAFCERFEQDLQLAAPGDASAWIGRHPGTPGPRIEFNRLSTVAGADAPRRVAYGLSAHQEIELWLWPAPGPGSDAEPARYAVLDGVTKLQIEFLNTDLAWVAVWPASPRDARSPLAVRLRVTRGPAGEIVRVFALSS